MKKKTSFKLSWIIVGFAILIIAALTPPLPGLSFLGKMAIALLITSVIWWITEPLPIAIVTWGLVALVPLMGMLTPMETWAAGMSPALVLYLSAFGFAVFFSHSSWSTRVAALVCKISKGDSKRLVLGFMIATAVISAFVDNLPLVAVMLPIAYKVLDANETPWGGKSALAKTLVIGIIMAAYIGGWITPVGCIMNILVQGYLASAFGITVSFVQWIIMGSITAVISLPLCWIALVAVLKPESLEPGVTDVLIKEADDLGALTRTDIIGLVTVIVAMVFWVLGSWFPIFDTATIGLVTLFIFFFPGLNIITFDDYMNESPWSAFLLVWGCGCLVGGIASTGAMSWLVETILMPMAGMPIVVIMIVLAVAACLIHNVLPSGPAVCGLISIPFISLAIALGGNPIATGFLCAVWSASAFLLPLDAPMFYGYSSKRQYFSFGDTLKAGALPSIVVILVVAVVIPAVCSAVGMV